MAQFTSLVFQERWIASLKGRKRKNALYHLLRWGSGTPIDRMVTQNSTLHSSTSFPDTTSHPVNGPKSHPQPPPARSISRFIPIPPACYPTVFMWPAEEIIALKQISCIAMIQPLTNGAEWHRCFNREPAIPHSHTMIFCTWLEATQRRGICWKVSIDSIRLRIYGRG